MCPSSFGYQEVRARGAGARGPAFLALLEDTAQSHGICAVGAAADNVAEMADDDSGEDDGMGPEEKGELHRISYSQPIYLRYEG